MALAVTSLLGSVGAARAEPSMAAVHWYGGSCFQANTSIPVGERGWNVESVLGTTDGTWINKSLTGARNAAGAGLRNIIRIDYRNYKAVPVSSAEYAGWANEFWSVANQFKNEGLATVFIVGNEPNIEGCTTASEYASAFNYLYSHAGRPAGITLLAAGPATYSPNPAGRNADGSCAWGAGNFLDWLGTMSNGLGAADGFALHTYGGSYEGCPSEPSQACSRNGWPFDAGFQSYKQQIGRITKAGLNTRPIYITEINTDVQPGQYPDPRDAYPADWINKAYQDVRNYNAANANRIKALAWFVDRVDGWDSFALRNIPAACQDMKEEFSNLANRPGTVVVSGNNAQAMAGSTSVAKFLMPGQISQLTLSMNNTGSTRWTAASLYRMGAVSGNTTTWSSFPQCGGYSNSSTDARIYVCGDVAPGGTYGFQVRARMPTTGTSAMVAGRMVQDGVAFFGDTQSRTIKLGSAFCGSACTQCILNERTDLLPFYQANGWDTSCGNRDNIVNNYCTGVDPSSCNALKAGACASFCNACRCSGGKHADGTTVDANATFCGYRVCGMDKKEYECTSAGWSAVAGLTCK
ncbi:hypothetical protein Q664_15300 [Archangium violaceum Cb vi76]|uniref:Uncharacterized protein n=2 Tax=Archangium violaceum TaxID=83451 RepID=A0A084SV91_9BACT|nr:hypothetical protein Q664_15300 [Archangium violaceum Cb vi76]